MALFLSNTRGINRRAVPVNCENLLIERLTALRGEVRMALEKIKNGTYGVCESCGEEIKSERLEALPVTSLCIECKKREEAKQRVKRTANL